MSEHPDLQKWKELSAKQLRGKALEDLQWDTPEGIRVTPLYTAQDLEGMPPGTTLPGRPLGKLLADAERTDCRAMCVGPKGEVWMGVAATFPKRGTLLHLVSYRPGDPAPRDHGPIAIRNPDYTQFTDAAGKPLPWHHGVTRAPDGTLIPRYTIMGICQARSGTVYLTTLYPFTLHEIQPQAAHSAK